MLDCTKNYKIPGKTDVTWEERDMMHSTKDNTSATVKALNKLKSHDIIRFNYKYRSRKYILFDSWLYMCLWVQCTSL